MAITCEIVTQPGGERGVVLSKDPFVVKVTSQDMVLVPGVFYSHEWEFEGAGIDGDTLNVAGSTLIAIPIVDVQTTFFSILSYNGSGCSSLNEWLLECVVPAMNMHDVLGRDFYWTASSSRLKAREKKINSAGYTLQMTSNVAINSLSEIMSQTSDIRINKLLVQVACSKNMASAEYVMSDEMTFDFKINEVTNTGEVEVDLSDVIDGLIRGWDNLNNIDSNGFRLEVMQRRVYVSVKQLSYNAAIEPQLKTKTVIVLKGGQRTNEWPLGYLPWVGNETTLPTGFIANKPKAVWCTKQAKNYLCWHNKWMDTPGDTFIKTEVYYASGTSAGNTIATIANTTKGKYEVWSVLAGFNDLALDDLTPGAAVVKYKLTVYQGDEANKIEQYFYLLPETDMGCTLVYRNALGVPDSMWCEGERTTAVAHSKELIDVGRGLNPTAITLREVSYGRSIKPSITLITAPMQQNEWKAMLDVLLSDEVRIHFPNTNTWVVGQIEPGTVEETTVNWAGANMVAMRLTVRLNEEAGWSARTF